MIEEIKKALEKISGPDASTPERVRAMRMEQENRYEWYAYLLDELEKADKEIAKYHKLHDDGYNEMRIMKEELKKAQKEIERLKNWGLTLQDVIERLEGTK